MGSSRSRVRSAATRTRGLRYVSTNPEWSMARTTSTCSAERKCTRRSGSGWQDGRSVCKVRELGQSAVLRRPLRGTVEKPFHLRKCRAVEIPARRGDRKHVAPCRERVHRHAEFRDDLPALFENIV